MPQVAMRRPRVESGGAGRAAAAAFGVDRTGSSGFEDSLIRFDFDFDENQPGMGCVQDGLRRGGRR